MSAKFNSSGNDEKNNDIAKIKMNLNTFNVDGQKSFLKFCKQASEVNFQNINLQITNGSSKFGKSMLCVSNNNVLCSANNLKETKSYVYLFLNFL